jgi:hypothetical protein
MAVCVELVPGGSSSSIVCGGVCGLTSGGEARCWVPGFEDLEPVPGERFQDIDAANELCGITQDKKLECMSGPVALGIEPSRVFMGAEGRGVLDDDGELACWGNGSLNVSAPGLFFDSLALSSVLSPTPSALDLCSFPKRRAMHACAIAKDQSLWCWGDGKSGQLGTGAVLDWEASPIHATAVQGAVQSVAVGGGKTIVVAEGALLELGAGPDYGRQCPGHVPEVEIPSNVGLMRTHQLDRVTDVYAGYDDFCALTEEGVAYCWGDNSFFKAGAPTIGAIAKPIRIYPEAGVP